MSSFINISNYLNHEEVILVFLAISLGFLAVNFNSTLALTYGFFIFIYYIMAKDGKTYPLIKNWDNPKWGEILVISGILTFAFFYIISGFLSGLQPYMTIQNLQIGFQTTAFEGNPILTLFTGSFVIGMVETFMILGAVLFFLAWFIYPRVEWKPTEIGFILLLLLTGITFSVFHATAYKISPAQMFSALIFMFISAGIMIKRGQMIEVALSHVMVNGIILTMALKLSMTFILVPMAMVGGILLFASRRKL